MKNVVITGGSGFIGRALCTELSEAGWGVEVLTRDAARARRVLPESVAPIESLDDANRPDVIVNLAGENLAAGRWTEARKTEMRESRLRTTRAVTEYMAACDQPPSVLISGSAVGYYGACGDRTVDESTPPGDEFQSRLCVDWEQAALAAESSGARVCLVRTGLVLGANDGALKQMITPFKFGLGGRFGSGAQYMPWIHIRDEVRAIRFLIEHDECRGPFNLSAPNPATNRVFTKTLARVLNRPCFAWVPGPVLKAALGDMARLLLTGQRAVPSALQNAGFDFEFDALEAAFRDLLTDTPTR